jgi:Amidase
MSADLDTMTAAELRRRIISKDVSPVELTRRALARAEATQATLNAFFVLLPESALAAARAAEDAVMRGQPLGLLHGLPFSAKDLMAVAGSLMRRAPARWPNLVSWVYYTYPFNLTGQPAATVCAGTGLPREGGLCRRGPEPHRAAGAAQVDGFPPASRGRGLESSALGSGACRGSRTTVPGTGARSAWAGRRGSRPGPRRA